MAAKDRKPLDVAARIIVDEAQAAENDRIFSATGFARENISIMHQQMRCLNLAWALKQTKQEEKRMLHRFRDKSHWYLSPNLNSRDLGERFDLLIDATGFGDEANPHGLADFSY